MLWFREQRETACKYIKKAIEKEDDSLFSAGKLLLKHL